MAQHTQSEWEALLAELKAVEERTGLYLRDENVDWENAFPGFKEMEKFEGTAQEVFNVAHNEHIIWDYLYNATCMAAGMRAEEASENINALLGRVIY